MLDKSLYRRRQTAQAGQRFSNKLLLLGSGATRKGRGRVVCVRRYMYPARRLRMQTVELGRDITTQKDPNFRSVAATLGLPNTHKHTKTHSHFSSIVICVERSLLFFFQVTFVVFILHLISPQSSLKFETNSIFLLKVSMIRFVVLN